MRRVYSNLQIPVLVLYDQDGYTSFGDLDAFLRNHMNQVATRIGNTRGLPHWEKLTDTAAALEYFQDETVPVIESAMARDTEHTSACATVKS
jgi:hypothetical protein